MQRSSCYNSPVSLELVYVHFPKAAGTALVQSLRNHYGESALMPDYSHSPPDSWSHDPPTLGPGVRAVFGHFHANRYAAYSSAFRFTFLREPVDNLISIYYFWRNYPPSGYPAHERFLAEQPTILEFAEYPVLRHLASSCYFGGVDIGDLDFVGFFERRKDDLRTLSNRLGFRLDPELTINRTSSEFDLERAQLREDTRTLRLLRERLADDVAFYERACDRWR